MRLHVRRFDEDDSDYDDDYDDDNNDVKFNNGIRSAVALVINFCDEVPPDVVGGTKTSPQVTLVSVCAW